MKSALVARLAEANSKMESCALLDQLKAEMAINSLVIALQVVRTEPALARNDSLLQLVLLALRTAEVDINA